MGPSLLGLLEKSARLLFQTIGRVIRLLLIKENLVLHFHHLSPSNLLPPTPTLQKQGGDGTLVMRKTRQAVERAREAERVRETKR